MIPLQNNSVKLNTNDEINFKGVSKKLFKAKIFLKINNKAINLNQIKINLIYFIRKEEVVHKRFYSLNLKSTIIIIFLVFLWKFSLMIFL